MSIDKEKLFVLAEALDRATLEVTQRAVRTAAGIHVDRMEMAHHLTLLIDSTSELAGALGYRKADL